MHTDQYSLLHTPHPNLRPSRPSVLAYSSAGACLWEKMICVGRPAARRRWSAIALRGRRRATDEVGAVLLLLLLLAETFLGPLKK